MNAEKLAMQKRIDNLCEQLELVKRQMDALMFDFKGYVKKPKKVCRLCGNRNKPICNMCEGCDVFEWRGLCKENGGVE